MFVQHAMQYIVLFGNGLGWHRNSIIKAIYDYSSNFTVEAFCVKYQNSRKKIETSRNQSIFCMSTEYREKIDPRF